MTQRVHIAFPLKTGPAGGGNQLLCALKSEWTQNNLYTDDPQEAAYILYNSYQYSIKTLYNIKRKYPDKLFIHRIDGPIRVYNSLDDRRDLHTNIACKLLADGIVFQSKWSYQENIKLNLQVNCPHSIIYNAPGSFFINNERPHLKQGEKIKILSMSWSDNPNKGFSDIAWLDHNLDFSKIEMTFIGRSPNTFTNIKMKPALPPELLATEIRQHHIFFFPSRKEACSNALLEAIGSGLPVIAYNDSSNPELVLNRGELYTQCESIPDLINKISNSYNQYQDNCHVKSIKDVASEYYSFFQHLTSSYQVNHRKIKRVSPLTLLQLLMSEWQWHVHDKIRSLIK